MNIHFDADHDNPKDCQLIVCITGTEKYIMEQVSKLFVEVLDSKKPAQGIITHPGEGNIQTITPVWNGRKY